MICFKLRMCFCLSSIFLFLVTILLSFSYIHYIFEQVILLWIGIMQLEINAKCEFVFLLTTNPEVWHLLVKLCKQTCKIDVIYNLWMLRMYNVCILFGIYIYFLLSNYVCFLLIMHNGVWFVVVWCIRYALDM